ncbi:MAG: YggT family protein [Tissierellia bacterium]|nr:YggT family protein [Tissierellia bacterium]
MVLFYEAFRRFVNLIELLIFIRIIMSFINFSMYSNPLGRIVYELTEPILAPARGLLARLRINTGMFDFSPIVAMLFLRLILDLVRNLIF